MPLFRKLPAHLQLQLKGHILVFIAEKDFVGCKGLKITDDMRVTIAAQACLLILNRPSDHGFPGLRQVLVYPGAFIVERDDFDEAGVHQRERRVLSGESWGDSQVILSWEDVVKGAAVDNDGWNVVIHEFAHQLDQQKGYASGTPELAGPDHYARWARVFNEEYLRLRRQSDSRQHSLLDDYGATDPAEFFAVVSEVFFEQPRQLNEEHPALFAELRGFYRVDPTEWGGRG